MILALMSLTAYRLTRLLTIDDFPPIAKLRYILWQRYAGRWQYYLLSCIWCVGVYVSGLVVAITLLFTSLPLPVLWWGAIASLVGIIYTIVEVGDIWNAKNAAE